MRYLSTRGGENDPGVDLGEAVPRSLAADGGLFMPDHLPTLVEGFWQNWWDRETGDFAADVLAPFCAPTLDASEVAQICRDAFDFPAPLRDLGDGLSLLELFHGPTLAFKDFGARFMARVMGRLARDGRQLTVLAATSGDTGGAVAAAFHRVPGIRVVILYPEGRVSPLQEKQLTTLGDNITALRVAGSFDDCQRLVKEAFANPELAARCGLTSANSINVARLLPQMVYYFEAVRRRGPGASAPVFVVPSGNFGNLTAGLVARACGLPVAGFVAATNRNDTVPRYLANGEYQPMESIATLSNAMDVGAPSNFERMRALFRDSWQEMSENIRGFAYDDPATLDEMRRVHRETGVILDPHTAVGTLAARASRESGNPGDHIVLATAHPAKFPEAVATALGDSCAGEIPHRLARLAALPSHSHPIPPQSPAFQNWLENL